MHDAEASAFTLAQATSPADLSAARELFEEYAAWLGVDLCFQGFAEELAALPGNYAPPRGRLLLARRGDAVAGCVALRPLDDGPGEVKRLFVRPAFRGTGLGNRLAAEIVAAARQIGYPRLMLDTLDWMRAARAVYAAQGFREVSAYYDNPLPGVVYMQLDL